MFRPFAGEVDSSVGISENVTDRLPPTPTPSPAESPRIEPSRGLRRIAGRIEWPVADYNHLRYHESIANLTPADVYAEATADRLVERCEVVARDRLARTPT